MKSKDAFLETSKSNFLSLKHLGVPKVPRILSGCRRSQVRIFPRKHTFINYEDEGAIKTHPLVPTVEYISSELNPNLNATKWPFRVTCNVPRKWCTIFNPLWAQVILSSAFSLATSCLPARFLYLFYFIFFNARAYWKLLEAKFRAFSINTLNWSTWVHFNGNSFIKHTIYS